MGLTNSQFDAVMRIYSDKKSRNHQILLKRQEEVYKRIPELTDIDSEVSALSVSNTISLLNGDKNATANLHDNLAALKKKRIDLMEANGFPANYLDEIYDCRDCHDSGYINGQKCHCLTQAGIDMVYKQSRLDDILERENFNTFSFEHYSAEKFDKTSQKTSLESAKDAYDKCFNFVQNFSKKGGNIFLTGTTGAGKTFLSNCIAKALLDQGFSVIYFTASELFENFEKEVFKHDENASEINELISTCDLLIIDDLGSEFSNSFTVSQLFTCLNERLLNRKSTVISSNLSLLKLRDTYSERISSRVIGNYELINIFGDDIRVNSQV